MTKERREIILNFDPTVRNRKLFLAIYCLAIMINIIFNWASMYNVKPDKLDELITVCSFVGFHLFIFAYTEDGFIREPARFFRKTASNNDTNMMFYNLYPVVPVKREYLLKEDFRYWKYTVILADATLTITNIIYFTNPALKNLPGYFVFVTLATSLGIIFDFAGRFYKKRWMGIGKLTITITYAVAILLQCFSLWSSHSNYTILYKFFECSIFRHFAGIPMLIVSIALAPVIFFIYNRYTSDGRKAAAWY